MNDNNNNLTAWEKVQLARLSERPNADEYIYNILDDFLEFHGDRYYGDDKSIIGGIGVIEGINVTVIGQLKGKTLEENITRNFGMTMPEGYRKSLRLIKQAEKFNRPVICFVDTPGAYCGVDAEERGQGEAIARNLIELMDISVPIVSIVIGEGGSGGALALSIADRILMLENAVYSIISPEGFASILWKDNTKAEKAAEVMKITADDLYGLGIIDDVIEEPAGGAHCAKEYIFKEIKVRILQELKELLSLDKEELLQRRYSKYRAIGKV